MDSENFLKVTFYHWRVKEKLEEPLINRLASHGIESPGYPYTNRVSMKQRGIREAFSQSGRRRELKQPTDLRR
jgi:hypothetical protein